MYPLSDRSATASITTKEDLHRLQGAKEPSRPWPPPSVKASNTTKNWGDFATDLDQVLRSVHKDNRHYPYISIGFPAAYCSILYFVKG